MLFLFHFDEFCMKTFQNLGKRGQLIIMAFISEHVKGKYSRFNALSCILTYVCVHDPILFTDALRISDLHISRILPVCVRIDPCISLIGVCNFQVDLGNPRSDSNNTLMPLIAGGTSSKLDLSHLHAPDPVSLKEPGTSPSSNVALCQMLPEVSQLSCESCVCGDLFTNTNLCRVCSVCHFVDALQQHAATLFPEPCEAFCCCCCFCLKNLTRTHLNPILNGM